jgi:hypothetical protein
MSVVIQPGPGGRILSAKSSIRAFWPGLLNVYPILSYQPYNTGIPMPGFFDSITTFINSPPGQLAAVGHT